MKILAFAPHSAIWDHAFPEALVHEALRQDGHEVVYVSCGGQFQGFCIPMSAHGLVINSPVEEKRKICEKCSAYKGIIRREFGFSGPDVIDLVTAEDREAVKGILASLTRDNYIDFEIDGIPVARYALYEFLINQKKDSVVLTEAEWQAFQPELTNTLFSFLVSRRLLDQEKPDRVLTYNSYYSVNHVCCALAEQRGIPHYFLHAGNNLSNRMQTLFVTRGYGLANWNRNPNWRNYRNLPCAQPMLAAVTDHLLALFEGMDVFAYSAPKAGKVLDLRAHFGVQPGQKVLLATMSSSDERVAAEAIGVQFPDKDCLFPTQVDWARALIEYAGAHPELRLILRVHPRNFPNKRERVKSAQAEVLEKLLLDLPENVRVNWPAEKISLYDLAEISDVVLNGWSNAGKEMSLLGLPVVLYSHDLVTSYPSEINYVGTTKEAYFSQVRQALADGWSFENIRKAYRWCAFEYYRSLINISESFPSRPHYRLTLAQRVTRRAVGMVAPHRLQELDCRRRAPSLRAKALINRVITNASDSVLDEIEPAALEAVTLDQETVFLKVEIRKVAQAMYGNGRNRPAGGLGEKLTAI